MYLFTFGAVMASWPFSGCRMGAIIHLIFAPIVTPVMLGVFIYTGDYKFFKVR
jgi:hypothetical protein